MITPDGLKSVRTYAEAIGPSQALVLDLGRGTLFPDRHRSGGRRARGGYLTVHSWTARPENDFLPPRLQKGDPKRADFPRQFGRFDTLLAALFATGIDGVFSDFPALAVKARSQAMALRARQERQRR